MLSESEIFVWEMGGASSTGSAQGDLGLRMQDALRRELRPLYYAVCAMFVFAYGMPLLMLEQVLVETWTVNAMPRFWVAMAVIFGAATLIVSPLLAFVAHERSEALVLLQSSRKFTATNLQPGSGKLRLRLTDCPQPCEVVASTSRGYRDSGNWMVYAIPEEANVAVIHSPQHDEVLVGRLQPLRDS